ncbi:MAG: YjjG family noncanonical pyrimidine nucleotidase [Sphaerochaetaceae bacterium]|nr:YjjG family noncanonical pyrimidine nucleotidase [Sphaerochaetaceae bacterium]
MKYKHLLFDADNTLFDFSQGEIETFKELGHKYNFEVTKSLMEDYHRINKACWKAYEEGTLSQDKLRVLRFENFINYFNFNIDPIEMEKDFTSILSNQSHLIKDTHFVLEQLSKQGYDIQLITNGLVEAQYGRLKVTDIEKYFSNIFISGEMGCQKPDVEYFDIVLDSIKAKKDECLVIGDRLESDILGAMKSNLDSVWLNIKNKDLPNEFTPTYVITDLASLLDILK